MTSKRKLEKQGQDKLPVKMSVNYLAGDKDMFVQILAGYPIVENKKQIPAISRKKKTWPKIIAEYNAVTTEQVGCNEINNNVSGGFIIVS